MEGKNNGSGPTEEAAMMEEQEVDGTEEAQWDGEKDLAGQYLEALQRERASFINYKRRMEQERVETVQFAASQLLKKLLPVMDDFDRALAAIPEEEKESGWVQGVELIAKKLHTILEQEGVEPIEAMNQPFDPNLHEAVAFDEGTAGEGSDGVDKVSEVFGKGYKLRDRVLRPAVVKVTRG